VEIAAISILQSKALSVPLEPTLACYSWSAYARLPPAVAIRGGDSDLPGRTSTFECRGVSNGSTDRNRRRTRRGALTTVARRDGRSATVTDRSPWWQKLTEYLTVTSDSC